MPTTYRPRQLRDLDRGRALSQRLAAAGMGALDVAMAAIETTFGPPACINKEKLFAERIIRMSFGHAAVRARFSSFIEWFSDRGIGLDEACDLLRDECAGTAAGAGDFRTTTARELHLILRLLRAKRMHRDFADTLAAVKANRPARVVTATSIAGGELIVCEGDALGAVVARFPRTEAGHKAALALVGE